MTTTTLLDRTAIVAPVPTRHAGLVLVRVSATASVTRDVLLLDTTGCLPKAVAISKWSQEVDRHLAELVQSGLIVRDPSGSILATTAGRKAAGSCLGQRRDVPLATGWPEMRDGALIAAALHLGGASVKRQRGLAKIDGLRLAIVESHWGLKVRGTPTPASVRSALAVVALQRAFGNTIKGGLGAKSALSPKASRLLAGQLAREPRDFGTDARLIAALCADVIGVKRSDLAALRQAVLKQYFGDAGGLETDCLVTGPAVAPRLARPPAAGSPPPTVLALPSRPDPTRFAVAVRTAARACAEGWPGNRKAFVSHVWATIRTEHPEWRVSEVEFKSMLAEAHRTGLIVLANADLKDKRHLKDIQDSAIAYKNTVWHYIRVEE